MKKRSLLLFGASALLIAPAAFAQSDDAVEQGPPNAPEFQPAFPEQTRAPESDSGLTLTIETFAEGLEHPWGIAALPDGGFLVTERPGRLRFVTAEGTLFDPVEGLPEVHAQSQGGLLDVAVGPTFAEDRVIYWTYAKPVGDGLSVTAAARGVIDEDYATLGEVSDIFVGDPPSPSPMHYGSRILIDDAGHAFITTGEHSALPGRPLAQDLATTYGKVIRIALDGSAPADNPFVDEEDALDTVWSYGHRNIQGAAFEPATGGALWINEHGARGGDELNLIAAGANYGWPIASYGVEYDGSPIGEGIATHPEGTVEPRYYWDPVIAPAGMTFYEGELFADWQGDVLIAGLNPGGLVRLELDGDTVTGEERLATDVGRIRDVVEDADGAVLILIDDADGSILRLSPAD